MGKKVTIPTLSRDLIQQLDKRFPDKLDTYEINSEFERGKLAGVIELLRELKSYIEKEI